MDFNNNKLLTGHHVNSGIQVEGVIGGGEEGLLG
jgi:hypothetical protein